MQVVFLRPRWWESLEPLLWETCFEEVVIGCVGHEAVEVLVASELGQTAEAFHKLYVHRSPCIVPVNRGTNKPDH